MTQAQTPEQTPEQIAEDVKILRSTAAGRRDVGEDFLADWYDDTADLIEALASQLAGAQTALQQAANNIAKYTYEDDCALRVMKTRAEQAEAARAEARDTITKCLHYENLLSLALARQFAGTLTEEFMSKVRAAQDEKNQAALKSSPQPPARKDEVMPDLKGDIDIIRQPTARGAVAAEPDFMREAELAQYASSVAAFEGENDG